MLLAIETILFSVVVVVIYFQQVNCVWVCKRPNDRGFVHPFVCISVLKFLLLPAFSPLLNGRLIFQLFSSFMLWQVGILHLYTYVAVVGYWFMLHFGFVKAKKFIFNEWLKSLYFRIFVKKNLSIICTNLYYTNTDGRLVCVFDMFLNAKMF